MPSPPSSTEATNTITHSFDDLMTLPVHMVGADKLAALGEWKLQNSKELTSLQEEHAQLLDKSKTLEEENKKYLSQLNQVLIEKDGLSKLELQEQLGEVKEIHSREQLELKNKHLEDQLQHARDQVLQYSNKLQRAKEVGVMMEGDPSFVSSDHEILTCLFIHHAVIVHCSSGWTHQGRNLG